MLANQSKLVINLIFTSLAFLTALRRKAIRLSVFFEFLISLIKFEFDSHLLISNVDNL